MTEAINRIRMHRTVCPRCRIGYFVSNDMPDADRFCTNCGYREPREGEAVVDFTKLYGR
jgi:ribosomal protein S27AE